MAYYVIDQTTNQLIYTSDFEVPNHFIADGHHVYESPISAQELNNRYEWSAEYSSFINKDSRLSKRNFIKKFSVQEYALIKTAAAQNATLDYYWQLFMLAEYVDLADADTISGIQMLEQVGLLQQGRSEEILNG